jgi:trimethylamine--corrinoid protein Co-methyltransferase
MANLRPNGIKYLRLSPEQCDRLHDASLEILSRTGVRMHLPEAVDTLRRAGASVEEGNRVRIPPALVEQALRSAPQQVTLYDRHGEPAIEVKEERCFYGPGSDCLFIVDHRTGQRRPAVLRDVVEAVRVCDALPHVDFVMSMFLPSDVDPEISDLHQMAVMLHNTTKPILFVTNEFEGCVQAVAMAEAVAGGAKALRDAPFVACYVNVTSGLRHNQEALQKLLFLADKGLPTLYIPVVTAGMSGPVTLPGSMASLNAGTLAGVVLSQLKREGAPVVVPGSGLVIIDMRTMVTPYCSPDGKGITHAIGHHYNLPVFGLGGVSESKLVDQQAAAEAALTLMQETMNGGNLIHDMGYLESGLSGSLAQLAICNEIVSWLKHYMVPVEVGDDTLALDLIDELGPEGSFIEHKHTLRHFRRHWYPDLFERGNHAHWLQAGGQSLGERAAARVEAILAGHAPEPLSEAASRAIAAILAGERAASQNGGG